MIIEIKGVQFVNKGAELMLHSIIQMLDENVGEYELVLASNSNSPYKKRALLGAYQKFNLKKRNFDMSWIFKYIPKRTRVHIKNKWGIVFEADIDLVLDASGFAYGDQWGVINLINTSNEILRLKNRGAKYIFLPQALGPFEKFQKNKMLNGLNQADLIFAREKKSYNYIKPKLSNTSNLYIAPDFTNLVKIKKLPDEFVSLDDKIVIIPNNNMISHRNKNDIWLDKYVDVLVNSVSSIRSIGYTPILLNHEGSSDQVLCDEINDRLREKVEVIYCDDAILVKSIIGKSKAIICSRFHGCVSALTQEVPCLGTSWSHKYEELFSEYNREEYLLSGDENVEQISDLLMKSINTISDLEYKNKVTKYKKQSADMWSKVFKIVKAEQ